MGADASLHRRRNGGSDPGTKDLKRTFTIYGDVRHVTRPLGIEDRSTITLVLVDGSGTVRWSGAGGFDPDVAQDLLRKMSYS